MLQIARLSSRTLGDSKERVAEFILRSHNPDGGFQNREGVSDLYYTVFGLQCLVALQEEPPYAKIANYLRLYDDPSTLDLPHLSSLARCWAFVSPSEGPPPFSKQDFATALNAFRAKDGGYSPHPGSESGSSYGAFLALGANQDFELDAVDAVALANSLENLRSRDGGYSNRPKMAKGVTTATAAAVTVLKNLQRTVPDDVQDWLLKRFYPNGGGFFAGPMTPVPDLLSTATALHALERLQAPMAPLREACLDYLDSLWSGQGGFYGHWADETLDCEYTYYGLLSLGHLSV
ncbi:hypothetical protein K8I31_01685 [bacterium]|nr:hypothetical protein [bacterium]